jgi:hypothetical protein
MTLVKLHLVRFLIRVTGQYAECKIIEHESISRWISIWASFNKYFINFIQSCGFCGVFQLSADKVQFGLETEVMHFLFEMYGTL